MKVNASTTYGLRAMKHIAEREAEGIVSSEEISKEYDIPMEYLLKIMSLFARAKFLHSKRGPRGGFSLAKPLNKISILDIIEAVEGPIANNFSLRSHLPKNKFAAKTDRVFERALAEAVKVLKNTKLSDLV